jgi:hypothetical protein
MRSRRLAAPLLAAVLLAGAVACSGDDDDSSATDGTTTTTAEEVTSTTTTEVPGPDPFAGYADHEPAQYAGTSNWICHPDLADDECTDLSTTVIAPDGSRTEQEAQRAAADDASFDCFYVYPTTSADPTPVADLDVDASERDTVRAQVGRYASACRVFAPAYRQVTLGGLGGGATAEDRELGYGDVVDAWKTYVVEENEGRGVVLIGHSQGAGVLRRLITEEIDGEPELRDLLVSALLLGSAVPAEGFPEVPPCASADDVGCVVSFAAYPAANPPVEGALFGKVRDSGEPALCVDPLALDPDGDALGDAVLVTSDGLLGAPTAGFDDVTTPFVSLPDAVRTSCAEEGGFRYLAIEVAGDDPRPLEGLVEQRLGPTWGLHLLDANLVQDDLIELVQRQAGAWAER